MNSNEYYTQIIQRLKQNKYQITSDIKSDGFVFDYVAKRVVFDTNRPGAFFNTFFLFSRFQSPDYKTLKNYSRQSYKFARKTFSIYIPPILFWGVRCFAVALVDSIDQHLNTHLNTMVSLSTPPRHWSGFEKLVIVDLNTRALGYYTLSDGLFGSADILDREVIIEMLSLCQNPQTE
jgi:hypothetical protein